MEVQFKWFTKLDFNMRSKLTNTIDLQFINCQKKPALYLFSYMKVYNFIYYISQILNLWCQNCASCVFVLTKNSKKSYFSNLKEKYNCKQIKTNLENIIDDKICCLQYHWLYVAISVSQNRQDNNKKPGFGLHLIVRCLLQIFMDRITFLDHKTPKGNT